MKNDTGNIEKIEEDGIFWITDVDVLPMTGLESPVIVGTLPRQLTVQADTTPWGGKQCGGTTVLGCNQREGDLCSRFGMVVT